MDNMQELVERLKQERDELRLKVHLASVELKGEWQEAERKLSRLESRMGRVGQEAKEAAEDVGEALEDLAEEIGKAFKRLRDAIK